MTEITAKELRQPLAMSMFVTKDDFIVHLERQRAKAADRIEEMETEIAEFDAILNLWKRRCQRSVAETDRLRKILKAADEMEAACWRLHEAHCIREDSEQIGASESAVAALTTYRKAKEGV
jgi:hypothetical protein